MGLLTAWLVSSGAYAWAATVLAGVLAWALVAAAQMFRLRRDYYRSLVIPNPPSASGVAKNDLATLAATGPIEWRWSMPNTIFGTSRRAGEGVWIDGFQILGRNRTDKPLRDINARLTPDITNKEVEMSVAVGGRALPGNFIPPRQEFVLTHTLPSVVPERSQGVSAEQYLADYAGVKFTFSYHLDGNSMTDTKYFSLTDIEEQIARIERETRLARPGG